MASKTNVVCPHFLLYYFVLALPSIARSDGTEEYVLERAWLFQGRLDSESEYILDLSVCSMYPVLTVFCMSWLFYVMEYCW